MRSRMSLLSRRELLHSLQGRYRKADRSLKGQILDEFVAATGYNREYATTLLNHPPEKRCKTARPHLRKPIYTTDTQRGLTELWRLSGGLCGKRLVAVIPDLLDALERFGELAYSEATKEQLARISAATVDRLLSAARRGPKPVGLSTTRPGTLLKKHIPVRTFAEWNENAVGFTEADLVAHCGETTAGEYLNTLNLTDVKTGWTECEAIPTRSQASVTCAVDRIRKRLPFALLGLDTDNGTEFINATLFRYCEEEMITFSRGRPYKKNDQCFVEQKNFTVVRKAIGYNRLEGEDCCRILNCYYQALRLYVNFFQPSMKLLDKQRQGSKVHKRYDQPTTPFRRVLDSPEIPENLKTRLKEQFETLNPMEIREQLEHFNTVLWKTAKLRFESEATIQSGFDS